MNKTVLTLLILILFFPFAAFAETTVVEGGQAKALYDTDKGKAQTLVQKNKEFILRAPGGSETRVPSIITVKEGERFYIVNEEDTFIHNVYDLTDLSWVLKKQLPSTVAAITFSAPGKHQLRCAIHPTMEIEVNVQ